MKRALCLMAFALGVACERASTPAPSAGPAAPASTPAPSPSERTPAVDEKAIEGWVLSRLSKPKRELFPLEHGLGPEIRDRHAVRATRDLYVEGPALWLHLFRFDGHAQAKSAEKPLTEALAGNRPELNYPKSTVSGAYLLVVGFPSEKPASPEMRAAQTEYLSAFAGEE